MLDDVAAYLILAPVAVVIVAALGLAGWRLRRRLVPVGVRRSTPRSSHQLSD